MSVIRCLVLAILAVVLVEGDITRYDGYTVLRLIPRTETQLRYLRELERNVVELDFWKGPSYVDRAVDVMVPPHLNHTFDRIFGARSFDKSVMIPDVEKQLEEVRAIRPLRPSRNQTKADVVANFFDSYQTYANINSFLTAVVSAYPAIAAVESAGTSYEGRNLNLIRIGVNQAAKTKPVIFFECGIHAREWISPATCLGFAQELVQGYGSSTAEIVSLLTTFDFIILPSANPDGYVHTQTTRLWRKTRKPYGSCYGADPNRNYGYQWGGEGASSNQCSETYMGSAAFSEPETKAISNYILAIKSRVKAFFAVHSYGQYWLYPWGYTSAVTTNNANLNRMALVATTALTAVSGTKYTVGTSTNVLYAAAGGADDWAFGGAGIQLAYTVELRDTGSYGFNLPASQIRASIAETTKGLVAFAKQLATEL